jgi:UDP:flavonoid glycosyltransferase YjiC (YdhE family)
MATILAIARSRGGGDVPPLIALVAALRERGHEVVLCCDPPAAELTRTLGVPALVDADGWSAAQARGAAAQSGGLAAYFDAINDGLVPVARRAVAATAPDLVLTSLLTAPLAERLAGGSVKVGVVNSTYYLRPDAGDAVADYFGRILERTRFVLHATDAVFDGGAALPPGHHYTGPLLWEPPLPSPSYLQGSGSDWVLVAVSSEPQGDLPIISAALGALASRPVRVVATTPTPADAAAIGPPPSNARIEGAVSHTAVLRRSRLLVSHAGHGVVMKALWHAVPMVLVPWSRDQPGVAARAERLGVARSVPKADLARLPDAIDEVLGDPSFARAAATHARRLRQGDPIGLACDFVERELTG